MGRDEKIRLRATAIVRRGEAILLVREPGETCFHLPGGGIERGESPITAVARELLEETGLIAGKIEFLFESYEDWSSQTGEYDGAAHSVFSVEADGEVALGPELCEFVWADPVAEIPLRGHAQQLLRRLSGVNR
jgi:8-oxo-dGTP diphosphatase